MLRIRIYNSLSELEKIRRVWGFVCDQGPGTIFQDFDWNMLAARVFFQREEPNVIVAEASYGIAIVPAVLRRRDGSLSLLGEELFDYRCFLHAGEERILQLALGSLAHIKAPLDFIALRECDRRAVLNKLQLEPFTAAPMVNSADVSANSFAARHLRLGRNLRRFQRAGFQLKACSGANSQLLRWIYESKAAQHPESLFHDPLRIAFLVEAAKLQPARIEIFTLESGSELAAALVTICDPGVRRFYTCFFSPQFAGLSPAMVLIHEVTRQSLASGLDCDYLTGEQDYKLRLATASMPLYRLRASSAELSRLSDRVSILERTG